MKNISIIPSFIAVTAYLLLEYMFTLENRTFIKLFFWGKFPEDRKILKKNGIIAVTVKSYDVSRLEFWEFDTKKDTAVFHKNTSQFETEVVFEGTLQQGLDKILMKNKFEYFFWTIMEENKIKTQIIILFFLMMLLYIFDQWRNGIIK